MGLYISKQELTHRICNGFVTHDGYVDGKFFDIYKDNKINVYSPETAQLLNCILTIIESMQDEGIVLYPKDLRGSKIRELRKRQGKSTGWLALKTGLSKTTIYDIERGLTKPRLATLEKIAEALRVEVEELG
mgnify:CR=1 FL=1